MFTQKSLSRRLVHRGIQWDPEVAWWHICVTCEWINMIHLKVIHSDPEMDHVLGIRWIRNEDLRIRTLVQR